MAVLSLGLERNYAVLPLILFSFTENSHFQNQKGKKKVEEVPLVCASRTWEEVQLPKVLATKWRA